MDEMLSRVSEFLQTAILIVLVIWSLYCAGKYPKKWLFQLLAGAFSCFLLGNIYLILHVWIMDDWPFVFSPADVSFLGLYSFMIAVDLGLKSEWTAEQQRIGKKYKRIAFLGPVVVILFHIGNIWFYPEIWLNNLIYCVLLSFLGYYAFLMFFTSTEKGGVQTTMHGYHTMILAFLMIELVLFLISSFGYYPLILYYLILYALTATLCLMVPAAKKGVKA